MYRSLYSISLAYSDIYGKANLAAQPTHSRTHTSLDHRPVSTTEKKKRGVIISFHIFIAIPQQHAMSPDPERKSK